jgi:4-hydroxybenzoate polyprenyltransferase
MRSGRASSVLWNPNSEKGEPVADAAQAGLKIRTGGLNALLVSLRPRQWLKNGFVLAPLVFAGRLTQLDDVVRVGIAFVVFCLISSAGYLVNDVADIESDRVHPVKRRRPIAGGLITIREARVAASVLIVAGLAIGVSLGFRFVGVAGAYVVLTVAYSLVLKQFAIIDALAIAAAFVLRSAGGAAAIDVSMSPWLYLATVLIALFLAFGKRRSEIATLGADAGSHRDNLNEYTPQLLDQLISITAAASLITYGLYTFYAGNLPANHSMMLTIPFVVCGLFRYLMLIQRRDLAAAPEEAILRDVPLLLNLALWAACAVAILYWVK